MGSDLPYISIAYYMQKGGEGVQKACKNAYVINGRPHFFIIGRLFFTQHDSDSSL